MKSLNSFLDSITLNEPTNEKTAIFMDFDECAVNTHLARLVTEWYIEKLPQNRKDDFEHAKNDTSATGVAKLCEIYEGDSYKHFLSIIRSQAKGAQWRTGFEKLWITALRNPRIEIFWVSSGLLDAIEIMFAVHGLELGNAHIFADRLTIEEGLITGVDYSVGEKEKQLVVEKIREKGAFRRIVTLGHSGGDKYLVQAGDPGFRLAFRDKGALVGSADHIIEDWNWERIAEFLQ